MVSRTSHRFVFLAVFALLAFCAGSLAAQNGRYMVEFKDFRGAAAAVRAAGGTPIYEFPELNVVAAHLPEQALRGLQNNPNVTLIEVDPQRFPMAQTIPYGITMVQAPQVTFGSSPAAAKVCIIDSGYYAAHEDLENGIVTSTSNSGTGDPFTDRCGHGTHVAGTISAYNNDKGVIGVVPTGTIQLHIVKVFGDDCSWAYSSDLINALSQCRTNGAKIVSMSLGGSFSSSAENTAFANAYSAGVLSIAAAGNGGNTRYSYPASYDSVMSVAAVDSNKALASFSQRNSQVEIAAPGVGVLSTTPFKASTVTVGADTFIGSNIDGSARTNASGALADGALCGSAGSWAGKVVLCERGTYSFAEKVTNVKNGGGVAAVIYNNVAGGFAGTLNGTSTIPAIGISQADGLVLKGLFGSSASVSNTEGTGSGYEAWDGTSMATPHVSGVAALVWSNFPSKSNAQIRAALQATAEDLGAAGRDTSFGYGLVRAKAAYDYLAGSTPVNNPPTANFTFSCSGLTCNFTDTSTDSDGSISSRSWTFGDGGSSTATNPSHSYAGGGTYNVTLTVIDNGGLQNAKSQNVTVSSSSTGITLTATGRKVKGVQNADLTWSGASGDNVDVYRNNVKIKTTANDGADTDNIGNKGAGSYTYKVCEAGTSNCSNTVTVSF